MNEHNISRRTMLKGMGACLALPLLESMRPLAAFGAPSAYPVRMAVLYMPNGTRPDTWTPTGLGSNFELSETLAPLAAQKDDLLVFSELWNAASNIGDGHYVKTSGFLTGTTITRTTGANLSSNGISMDQLCARHIGNQTPLPSLELGIEPPATGVDSNVGYTQLYGSHVAWSAPSSPLAKEINPKQAFDRLFRPKTVQGDCAAAATRDHSVLDLVSEEAKALQNKLSATDRDKLSEYLDSVRSVERRIEWDAQRQNSTVLSDPLACKAIESLGQRVDAYNDPTKVSERSGDHSEHVRLMLDIIALAFWTDATRIATFMFGNAVSSRSFAFLGEGLGSHHEASHHENKPERLAQYQRINLWHIEQYAYLLAKLKSIPEGEGTLLDHSMILFGAGIRDGNAHDPHDLPIVVAGRAGGTLATGRHIVCDKDTPLSNLYLSMLIRMGAPVDHFADSTGELPGLASSDIFTSQPKL